MYNFTTETQGLDTFRVSEIINEEQIDTVGFGMLLNNKIAGLCPMSCIQTDNREYIRYNISSQITLEKFFSERVDKRRFLNILNNILTVIGNVEDYMLEPGMLILDNEEIYINVGTLQTYLIYYPIVSEKHDFNVSDFVKKLIINTEFDSNENGNYVTQLINYLNSGDNITINELKKYISNLLNEVKAAPVYHRENVNPHPQNYQQIPPRQEAVYQQMPYPQECVKPTVQQPQPVNAGFAIPGQDQNPQPQLKEAKSKNKKTFLEMLGFKSSGEKVKKEKIKPEKKKTVQPQPMPQPQPMVQPQPIMPQPMPQPQPMVQYNNPPVTYGETVTLGVETSGETTVLNAGYNTLQRQHNPYLIRKRTGEKVEITKDTFRIGKEMTYVDYCIRDNSAVSRSHADIVKKNNEFYIVDNNSLNHTFVNNNQIPSSSMCKLEDYMTITLADEVFEFRL